MGDWIEDIIGYVTGFAAIIWSLVPKTYDGWSSILGLIAIAVTLFGITIPKAWGAHKLRKAGKADGLQL